MASKEGVTNAGKKETRQINQVLNQPHHQDQRSGKEVEARTAAKERQLDKNRSPK